MRHQRALALKIETREDSVVLLETLETNPPSEKNWMLLKKAQAEKRTQKSLSHWVEAPSLRPPSVAWVPAPVRPNPIESGNQTCSHLDSTESCL